MFIALWARKFRRPAKFGRMRGVRFRFPGVGKYRNYCITAIRAWCFAFWRGWDVCAACSKAGPVMGLCPLCGPPCIPPGAPPKKAFNFLGVARARVLCCGSFPPSLRSLRRSPSATRKCQSTLVLQTKSASAEYHLRQGRCSVSSASKSTEVQSSVIRQTICV